MDKRHLTCAALLAALILLLPADVSAQQIGAKAGLNVSSVHDSDGFEGDSHRTGLVAGLWLRTPAPGRFSFQAEGLFSEKGFTLELDVLGIAATADMRVRYIEVPLLARMDAGRPDARGRVFFVAGAAPAFRLDAHSTTDFHGEEQRDDVTDDFKPFDLGIVAGAGVEVGRVLIEARYTHGLLSIPEDPDSDQTIRNRTFSVMAGFRFR